MPISSKKKRKTSLGQVLQFLQEKKLRYQVFLEKKLKKVVLVLVISMLVTGIKAKVFETTETAETAKTAKTG